MRKFFSVTALTIGLGWATPGSAGLLDWHFGDAACHFQDANKGWVGVYEDTPAHVGQCMVLYDIFVRRSAVEFEEFERSVPCNANICTDTGQPVRPDGTVLVPRISNLRPGN